MHEQHAEPQQLQNEKKNIFFSGKISHEIVKLCKIWVSIMALDEICVGVHHRRNFRG